MSQLIEELRNIQKIDTIFQGIRKKEQINLSNVKMGLKGFLTLITFAEQKKHVLYLTASDREAQKRTAYLKRFRDRDVLYYPTEPVHTYFADAKSQDNLYQRMCVIEKLMTDHKYIVVTSIEAVLKKLMPKDTMSGLFFQVKKGDILDPEELTRRLADVGYERVEQVEAKGQFAKRGGIIDVFNVTSEKPFRFDFFDDEIDSIRVFNPETQLSSDETETVQIAPARDLVLSDAMRQEVFQAIDSKYGDAPLYQELITNLKTENHDETLFTFLNAADSLLDYFDDFIGIYDEYPRIREAYNVFMQKTWTDYEMLIREYCIFEEEKNRFIAFHTVEKIFDSKAVIRMNLFNNRAQKGISLDMNSKDLESFAGQLPLFIDFLKRRLDLNYTVFICCKTDKTLETVKNHLLEEDIFRFSEDGPGIHLTTGEISEGFEMEDEKIICINESEIFKEHKKKKRITKSKGKKIDSFAELHLGDYVVHDIHGIGIYRGIEQMEIDGIIKDLMVIEYQNDAKLYIPVEQMDSVQVYIGTGGDRLPKINAMGNPDWQKTKSKAKKAVEDMAEELIALYAKRRAMHGYAFGPDSSWQQEFEDDFPYTETEDQLRCVDEIKADMESDIPMDRLLCGDVGYGKTEVALRAAFKAVMEGKQVAVLVPTTILAQQHYNTVKERFKKYPVNIGLLSRFRTPTQQKKTIIELKSGELDLVIGTHRLLSRDIQFKDLGLLIIDEEQRFGVRSKEKIKQMRENIDVLTLSATPIPRTLHMSMTGVRDMSVIEEPPTGRRPVQTYVMAYNPLIVQDAVSRELARGGQVYYVHNRVYDINETALEIKRLVPEARVVTAHGKMSGSELEAIMLDFLNHEFDVLVATTIVESGIDVKNANTMIVDNGDCFGLSQLYQLRGRVGRSDIQAYAYITHRKDSLSEVAQKRLKAIRDFTAFGSGFKVAMRDLEIRGAGNLLGAEQSGHLFKIGYELYCRILEEAISRKMGGKIEIESEEPIRINLDVSGYIPQNYISSEEIKYDIYKKLTYIQTLDDYDALETELIDRFGDIPNGVYNLMAIAVIKYMAYQIGVREIQQKAEYIYLTFSTKTEPFVPDPEIIPDLVSKYQVKFNAAKGKTAAPCWSFCIRGKKDREVLKEVTDFFQMLKV